jgi:hypothetical protein
MRTLLQKSLLACIGLAILTAACADKNSRFESKTFVNKGQEQSKTNKNKKVTASPSAVGASTGIVNKVDTKINFINPSKLSQTQLVIELKSVRALFDYQNLNEMELTADVVLSDPVKKIAHFVQRVDIETSSSIDGFLKIDKEIVISRAQINDYLQNLIKNQGSNADTGFVLELTVNYKSKTDEDSKKCRNASVITAELSSMNSNGIELDSILSKCNEESDKKTNLAFTASVKTKDFFAAEKILYTSLGLTCEVINSKEKTSQLVVITKSGVQQTLASNDKNHTIKFVQEVLNSPQDNLKSNEVVSAKIIQQKVDNEYTEYLSTNSLNESEEFTGKKAFITLREQACDVKNSKTLGINLFKSAITIEQNDVQNTVLKGCCLESTSFLIQIMSPPSEEVRSDNGAY